MFSALTQGSLIYILDKTDKLTFKIGQVVGISQPKYGALGTVQTVVDIKVSTDGQTYDYNSIPSNLSLVTYNGGKVVLSETKQGLQQEVEATLQNSKQILNNIEHYKTNIADCESILKELNPQFKENKERDERLENLETRFTGVEDKLDRILTQISKTV